MKILRSLTYMIILWIANQKIVVKCADALTYIQRTCPTANGYPLGAIVDQCYILSSTVFRHNRVARGCQDSLSGSYPTTSLNFTTANGRIEYALARLGYLYNVTVGDYVWLFSAVRNTALVMEIPSGGILAKASQFVRLEIAILGIWRRDRYRAICEIEKQCSGDADFYGLAFLCNESGNRKVGESINCTCSITGVGEILHCTKLGWRLPPCGGKGDIGLSGTTYAAIIIALLCTLFIIVPIAVLITKHKLTKGSNNDSIFPNQEIMSVPQETYYRASPGGQLHRQISVIRSGLPSRTSAELQTYPYRQSSRQFQHRQSYGTVQQQPIQPESSDFQRYELVRSSTSSEYAKKKKLRRRRKAAVRGRATMRKTLPTAHKRRFRSI